MKNFIQKIVIWIAIFLGSMLIYDYFSGRIYYRNNVNLAFSDFLDAVESGQISKVTIQGREIKGLMTDGSGFKTNAMQYGNLVDTLRANKVQINVGSNESLFGIIVSILISWLPLLLLVGVWIFFLKQAQVGGNKALGFGRSKIKMYAESSVKVTFKDVAGIGEAKEELGEVVDFLKNPAKFQALGGKIPKGCLLIGGPGTGKTLLAKAIAGEAKVPFFSISGSDFVEMFVGVGASRVRDMFEQGKKHAPCIIFIDEIDAVGRHRGSGVGGGNDEREQTLNQLLVEMDGFETNEGVIIIAATNRPDVLDSALLRPGRFDRRIHVPMPDIKGRDEILNVHARNISLAPNVVLRNIARATPGFSGADLANLINEAALVAARKDKKVVTMEELEHAKDKVMMGAERKSLTMKEEERKLTAYHEAGHALIALNIKGSDPVYKATIIPRGHALGLVMRLPEDDKVSVTREQIIADITVAMGGRLAEEIIFGPDKVTSGASSDIKQATELAKSMVMKWGMSEKIGPLYYGSEENSTALHKAEGQGTSDDVQNKIDNEIKIIVMAGYENARKMLAENIEDLHKLAQALLKYETLTGDEMKRLLAGEKIDKDEDDNMRPSKKSSFAGPEKNNNMDIPEEPQEA
ncbi:ATP-dependent zinc metalloprotease FtsH [Rickettsiales bacterium]|nr:ATP-dependent zinc metalloprotease FtsH [Rickettsiales bacterium]